MTPPKPGPSSHTFASSSQENPRRYFCCVVTVKEPNRISDRLPVPGAFLYTQVALGGDVGPAERLPVLRVGDGQVRGRVDLVDRVPPGVVEVGGLPADPPLRRAAAVHDPAGVQHQPLLAQPHRRPDTGRLELVGGALSGPDRGTRPRGQHVRGAERGPHAADVELDDREGVLQHRRVRHHRRVQRRRRERTRRAVQRLRQGPRQVRRGDRPPRGGTVPVVHVDPGQADPENGTGHSVPSSSRNVRVTSAQNSACILTSSPSRTASQVTPVHATGTAGPSWAPSAPSGWRGW